MRSLAERLLTRKREVHSRSLSQPLFQSGVCKTLSEVQFGRDCDESGGKYATGNPCHGARGATSKTQTYPKTILAGLADREALLRRYGIETSAAPSDPRRRPPPAQ